MLGATFTSYAGVSLPADRYLVHFDAQANRRLQVESAAVLVARGARPPAYATQTLAERRLLLAVKVIDSANLAALSAELLRGFDAAVDATAKLVVADRAGRDWYVYAKVTGHQVAEGEHHISLVAPDGIWYAEVESRAVWNPTGSPSSKVMTVGGTHPAGPAFTVTPAALRAGGLPYRRFITIYNPTERAFPNYPIELTGGGLDTAALVSAGKLQADGDDLRIVVDGKRAARWLADMNSAATKVWINLDLSPKVELSLASALGSGALNELDFEATYETRAALRRLPPAGILLIDSELFTYTAVDVLNCQVSGVTRAAKWTSASSHAAGATARWIEHDIRMLYGNSAAGAPLQGVAEQPIFELVESSNTAWVYENFAQGLDPNQPLGRRTGSWSPLVIDSTGGESGPYRGAHGVQPSLAAVMGLAANVWLRGNRPQSEHYVLAWNLEHPAGITNVAMDGEKFRSSAQWAAKARLQLSENGRLWNDSALAVASPAAAGAWTAWNFNGALGAAYRYVRLLLAGTLAGVADRTLSVEVSNATLTLDSAAVPSVSLGAEMANTYHLDFRIRNATTGEMFALQYPIKLGQAVRIDCEQKTALSLEDNADIFRALDLPVQSEWMTLQPGENSLVFTEDGVADVDLEISWRDRAGGV